MLASNFIKGKIILDVACGTGYGSFYLSQFAKAVYGVDVNNDIINENIKKYKNSNLQFICSSAENLPFENDYFDVIVSFETIEHIHDYQKVMIEFKRVLKKDGLLIISTPNKLISEINHIRNPFHIKEFYHEEFEKLLSSYFSNKLFLYQVSCFASMMVPEDTSKETYLEMLDTSTQQLKNGVIASSEDENWNKHYFIALASDEPIKNQNTTSILNASEYTKSLLSFTEKVYNSTNYKLGYYLTFPFKLFLHLLGIRKYPDIIS
jgi:ubiquinone/menaquinone biosynthesis C-methylase UbiE